MKHPNYITAERTRQQVAVLLESDGLEEEWLFMSRAFGNDECPPVIEAGRFLLRGNAQEIASAARLILGGVIEID